MTVSVIVRTRGLPALANALGSLSQLRADDEVMVLIDGAPGEALRVLSGIRFPCRVTTIVHGPSARRDGGIRDLYAGRAKGEYVLHVDEEDACLPGAFDAIRRCIEQSPGKMLVFGAVARDGPALGAAGRPGPLSGQRVVLPNQPQRWGRWEGDEAGADLRFFSGCRFERAAVEADIAVVRPHEWASPADCYVVWRTRPSGAAGNSPAPAACEAVSAEAAGRAAEPAPGPAPFSFSLTRPDGTRELRAVAYGRDESGLYPPAGPLRAGLVIGTHASTAYVHLGLESCRRFCPRVEVLVHDDASAEWLGLSARMWLAQEAEPLLVVVDTGSKQAGAREAVAEIGRHPRAEAAYLEPKWPTPHIWDMVSIAHDYGLSRCQTEFVMTTHTDVFPKHRGVVSYMRRLCGADEPVVGWEMSRRGRNLSSPAGPWISDGFVGMACTIMHVATLDRIGAGWSIRRAHHVFGTSRNQDRPGWPDNETCMGHLLHRAGIQVRFLGRETNFENQETEHWLHARSMTLNTVLNRGLEPRHARALARMRGVYASWGVE